MKGYPKNKSNYEPTNKTYKIHTIADIVALTPEQYEFFIDDLREYCNVMRSVQAINELPGVEVQDDGTFDWIDN